MTDSTAPAIRLRDLTRSFGDVVAVDSLDLDIPEGEFFSMLGPSGSGKTTVLRLIAGFDTPTSGTIELFGEDVTDKAAFDRDVNTVFQDYALFPHMSVQQNVEFGLSVRRVAAAERRRLAGEMLERMQLGQHARRRPHELSGGQRQRVALARALVVQPRALLLDEPLGALDLKLREQMQVELKQLQRELGITFIFVTHDQEEALTLSDRIAVFRDGRIEQVGMARDLYERPATPFVANFLGTSNLVEGELAERLVGRPGTFSVRPERIVVGPESGDGALGTVAETIYLGSALRLVIDLDGGGRVVALEQISAGHSADESRGDRVRVRIAPIDAVELDAAEAAEPALA